MKFTKVRNVKTIERGTSKSAGVDFYVPFFDEKFVKDLLEKNPSLLHITDESDAPPIFYSSHIKGNSIILFPHDRILIPSGVHVNFTEEADNFRERVGCLEYGLSLNANNKSGVGSKKGLSVLACVIDEDYEGEIHINLVNTGNMPVAINEGEKIIQFLLQPVFYANIVEEPILANLYINNVSERKDGGFGHTDKK
jgi:dUTPase